MRHVIAASLLLALPATSAAVPMELSHQGRLQDAVGAALDGAHDVHFALYDAPAAGAVLWEADRNLTFDRGYFDVRLGSSVSLDASVFAGDDVYMGISVDGGAELPQRLRLVSVPFAVRADSSASVSGGIVDASEIRIDGTTVIDGSGTVVAPSSGVTLGDLACADGEVAGYTSTGWDCVAVGIGSHTHDASEVDAGVLAIGRIPIGTGAGTAAAGDHGHDASHVTTGTLDVARLLIGTGGGTVAAGDHGHTAADVGALPSAGGTLTGGLSGTDATFSGNVQVGDAGATCDAAAAGTMRWAANQFEVCDGTAWRVLVGAAPAGSSPSDAGDSCSQIKTDFPSSGDGPY